jgi:hypothetical protein
MPSEASSRARLRPKTSSGLIVMEREVDVQREPRPTIFDGRIKAGCLLGILLFCCSLTSKADQPAPKILLRPELALDRRVELIEKLRRITGWAGLDFDGNGALQFGGKKSAGGSQTARELLAAASTGQNVIVIEDASGRQDVVFCKVVEGRWKTDAANKPPVFVVLIDFTDFSHVMGDEAALAAFNVGWGVLHEIEHVVNDSVDPESLGEAGQCEAFINRMRRECGLAERAEYFFTFLPGTTDSTFMTKFVRIAFDQPRPGDKRRKRHWLVWDASLVGGLEEQKVVAARM